MKKFLLLLLLLLSIDVFSQEVFSPFEDFFLDYERLDNPAFFEAIRYKDYIVLTKLYDTVLDGFVVYPYVSGISIDQYPEKYVPVYETAGNDSAWLIGISGENLFIDYGTSPGLRGIEVYSLSDKKSLYKGSYLSGQLRFLSFGEFTAHRESSFEELEELNKEQYRQIVSIDNFEEQKEWIGVYREYIVNIDDSSETATLNFRFVQIW